MSFHRMEQWNEEFKVFCRTRALLGSKAVRITFTLVVLVLIKQFWECSVRSLQVPGQE